MDLPLSAGTELSDNGAARESRATGRALHGALTGARFKSRYFDISKWPTAHESCSGVWPRTCIFP